MQPLKLLKVEEIILPKIELVQVKFSCKLLPKVENDLRKMSKAKYQDFANRLNNLMKAQGSPITTVNQLKDAIGVTYEMARRYTLGTAKPREDKMKGLAKNFGIDIGFLDHGTQLESNIDKKIYFTDKSIPVISWVAAGVWTNIESIPTGTEFNEWLPPNTKCGKNGYALIVEGSSMSPRFEPGDRIYVNPDFQVNDLKTGDLVIVSCEGQSKATFKKLIIETNGLYLEPLNPDWPERMILLTDDCRLVGKVVGLYRDVS